MPRLPRETLCLLLATFGIFLVQTAVPAQSNWPRFRGPDGSGHWEDARVPILFSADNIVWRSELPGQGHSSVCIWQQHLYLTAARQNDAGQVERLVICLNRSDGTEVWRRVASTGGAESVHKMNSFATPTCATDGQQVVAFFGRGGIHCYDPDGKPLWSHDLGSFPGPWGTGASPVIVDNMVIQNCDAEGKAHLTAFDKLTGETLWRTSRGDLPRGGWNTPFVIDSGSRRELILNGESGVRGYDPATGQEHWFCRSFNGRGTPVPAFGHGLLFVISGKPGDVYAVRPGGEGDVTQTRMAWHTRRGGGRDLSSPILVDNHLFVVNMIGIGTCYDTTTGKELWQARLGGNYSASPIAVNGLVYIQNEVGETMVIKLGSELNVVARSSVPADEGEIFRSTLAPSDGQLFMRSNRAVYCIGQAGSG